MARQQHGFDFEVTVSKLLDGFIPAKGGQLFDGYYKGTPVSIKTRKAQSMVCLGDYRRQSSIDVEFILIVGTYRGTDYTVDALLIPAGEWKANLTYSNVAAMYEELKLITNSHIDDDRWTEFRKRHSAAFDRERTSIPFKLAMKRDSKTQKRIQLQISDSGYRLLKRRFKSTLQQFCGAIGESASRGADTPARVSPRNKQEIIKFTDQEVFELLGLLDD